MFASIRKYKSNSPDELIRRATQAFVPIISKAPGFIAYYLVKSGNGGEITEGEAWQFKKSG